MIPAPGAFAAGLAIFLIVLWEAFEAILLPRRATRKFRLTRLFFGVEGACERQAELTFAIARHAVVDLSQVFGTPPKALPQDRLPAADLRRIRDILAQHGLKLHDGPEADACLAELRQMYEPYIFALSSHLLQLLPSWIPKEKGKKDNWQTTAWGLAAGMVEKEHAHTHDDPFDRVPPNCCEPICPGHFLG
jgi:hypothetical protein